MRRQGSCRWGLGPGAEHDGQLVPFALSLAGAASRAWQEQTRWARGSAGCRRAPLRPSAVRHLSHPLGSRCRPSETGPCSEACLLGPIHRSDARRTKMHVKHAPMLSSELLPAVTPLSRLDSGLGACALRLAPSRQVRGQVTLPGHASEASGSPAGCWTERRILWGFITGRGLGPTRP